MTRRIFSTLGLKALHCLAFATQIGVVAAQIPDPGDTPQPLSPQASAAAYQLPPGFRMEVVASEPLIASPSGVCWDARGNLFVSELHGYNLEGHLEIEELNKTGRLDTEVRRVQADEKFKQAAEQGTYGVVKRLIDTNGDGRLDQAETWASDLPPAYGLVPSQDGVIVACAPDILFLADRDGDGVAEVRKTLFTGFRTGALERGINAPQWGMDGWIYFGRGWGGSEVTGPELTDTVYLPDSDFRIRPDGSAIEPVTGATRTFGFAMTAAGDRFVVTTTVPAIYVAPLPWQYLMRNPDAATPSLEAATGDRHVYELSRPHPWRQKRADDPAYFQYYKSRYGAAESEAAGWFTAACGPMLYRDPTLPGLQGQYFVCEPAGNLIHRGIIQSDGPGLTLQRAASEQESEFAATPDQWSHPIRLSHGPDGSIWVVDYYREIIEDYSAIPRYLQQQYGLYAGHDRGRLYRITHRDAASLPHLDLAHPNLADLDVDRLVRECVSPLYWRRQTAQRLLVERREVGADRLLRSQLDDHVGEPESVIYTLRTLDLLGRLEPSDVIRFFQHTDPAVRVHAIQLGDRWLRESEQSEVLDGLLAAAAMESHPRVQIQIALSLGESQDPRSLEQLADYARQHSMVRWMDAALLSSLHGRAVEMLALLLPEPGDARLFMERLLQSISAGGREVDLSRTLKLIDSVAVDRQAGLLSALAEGRKDSPRQRLQDADTQVLLARFASSPDAEVRDAADALAEVYELLPSGDLSRQQMIAEATNAETPKEVSDEVYRQYRQALAGKRDEDRGQQLFVKHCSVCHRIGQQGNEVGPDLLGQTGMSEETLLTDVLSPSARMRPGYESTIVLTADGNLYSGVLKDDGATSLTIVMNDGKQRVILRKDVELVRRSKISIMPSVAGVVSPSEIADLFAWLKSQGVGSSSVKKESDSIE